MKTEYKDLVVSILLIVVFSGGAVAIKILVPPANPNLSTSLFGLMIAGFGATIVWAMKRFSDRSVAESQLRATQLGELIVDSSERINLDFRTQLMPKTRNIPDHHLRNIAQTVLTQCKSVMTQIVEKQRELKPVEDALAEWIVHVKAVKPPRFSEIIAVCGSKDFRSSNVKKYYEANYEAAGALDSKRILAVGNEPFVTVRRIFILPQKGKDFPDGEPEVIRDHMARMPNVKPGIIEWEACDGILRELQIPERYGFAILGDSVGVHWGFHSATKAMLLNGHVAVAVFRHIFENLWVLATTNKVEIERRLQEHGT